MHDFYQKDKDNAIAIHCDHGKGRTGTLACAYLLFSKIVDTHEDAIDFFYKQRGNKVMHACQLRYL